MKFNNLFIQFHLEPEPWENIQSDIETKIIPGSSLLLAFYIHIYQFTKIKLFNVK